MLYKRVCLLSVFLLLGLLYSCQKPSSSHLKTQTLRTCIPSDISSLDPRTGTDMLSQGVVRMIFSGLAYLDQTMTPQLDLASSYLVSKDYKTYTFVLRDCCWSDGSLITARDFEETWKTALTSGFVSTNSNLYYFIKNAKKALSGEVPMDQVGIHAIDNKTLIIELEKPHPHFLNVLTNSVFSPVHQSLRHRSIDMKHLVCSGPFRLKKYIFQNQIVLEKNPHYWGADQIHLKQIDYLIVKDASTALLMFEKGELDWVGDPLMKISADAIPDLKAKGLLHNIPAAGTHWLFFNTNKYPLNNANIRKALACAIDRRKILKDLFHDDHTLPALGLIPQILKKKRWHPWFQDNDIKKAQEYLSQGLKELGITAEQLPPITIYYAMNNLWSKVIQAVQQMWEQNLGIHVKCEGCDGQLFIRQIYNYEHDVARFGWVMQYDDPVNLLETFKLKHNRPNLTAWEDPEYIRHTDASYVDNEEEKWRHIEAAEKIFFDEMPSIPISELVASYIEQPYVKGVSVNYLYQINFRWTTLEP